MNSQWSTKPQLDMKPRPEFTSSLDLSCAPDSSHPEPTTTHLFNALSCCTQDIFINYNCVLCLRCFSVCTLIYLSLTPFLRVWLYFTNEETQVRDSGILCCHIIGQKLEWNVLCSGLFFYFNDSMDALT
jgi:hypothetical protein